MHGAEMIAYNAQPAAMTSEMWVQNYLSTINEVAAVDFHPHAWITPGSRLDHGRRQLDGVWPRTKLPLLYSQLQSRLAEVVALRDRHHRTKCHCCWCCC